MYSRYKYTGVAGIDRCILDINIQVLQMEFQVIQMLIRLLDVLTLFPLKVSHTSSLPSWEALTICLRKEDRKAQRWAQSGVGGWLVAVGDG